MTDPIRLALIGAGIFAREAHVPALKALAQRFEIAAVYSRTQASAEALLALIPGQPDLFTDLDALLARRDIEAVDVLLPIENMPAAIERALEAGKHVVSEKPIAPDLASGRRLIELNRRAPQLVWMVAENWRYEAAFQRAREVIVSGHIGQPLLAHWPLHIGVHPSNKYYHTDWRRSGTWPGGFLLDGGVHHVAVLRQVLGEITAVSAQVRQMRADLPPADTLSATVEFKSGLIATYAVSYAAAAPFPTFLSVVGDRGALRVDRGVLEVTHDGVLRGEPLADSKSVNLELAAFADAIRNRQPHRNSPLEALHDLAVVETMLQSAQRGSRIEVDPLDDLETPV